MKNLVKVLLVLAFSTSVFASAPAVMPAAPAFDPAVTTQVITSWPMAAQQAWLNALTVDQYNAIQDSAVQSWVQATAGDAKKAELGIN